MVLIGSGNFKWSRVQDKKAFCPWAKSWPTYLSCSSSWGWAALWATLHWFQMKSFLPLRLSVVTRQSRDYWYQTGVFTWPMFGEPGQKEKGWRRTIGYIHLKLKENSSQKQDGGRMYVTLFQVLTDSVASWKSWRSDWRGFSFLLCFTPRKRWAVWKEHRFKLLYSDNHIWISVIVFSCRVRPCGSFGPSARPSRFVTNWVCSTRSRTLTDRRIAMATRTATTPLRQVHKNTHNTHCRTDKDSAGTGNRTTTDWATGFCVV